MYATLSCRQLAAAAGVLLTAPYNQALSASARARLSLPALGFIVTLERATRESAGEDEALWRRYECVRSKSYYRYSSTPLPSSLSLKIVSCYLAQLLLRILTFMWCSNSRRQHYVRVLVLLLCAAVRVVCTVTRVLPQ